MEDHQLRLAWGTCKEYNNNNNNRGTQNWARIKTIQTTALRISVKILKRALGELIRHAVTQIPDVRRLDVTQTSEKKHQLKLAWKTCKEKKMLGLSLFLIRLRWHFYTFKCLSKGNNSKCGFYQFEISSTRLDENEFF